MGYIMVYIGQGVGKMCLLDFAIRTVRHQRVITTVLVITMGEI